MPRNKSILDAIDKADPTLRKSRLAAWMRANHDALDARLRGHRTVWSVLATVFSEQGLVDAKGNPPTAEGARKTWQRIKREVKRDREANAGQTRLNALAAQPVTLPHAPRKQRSQPNVKPPLAPAQPEQKADPATQDDLLAGVMREMNQRSGRKP